MKSHKHLSFSVKIICNGAEFTLKGLKYAAKNVETLYKIALPSALTDVKQCWLSKTGADYKLVLGKPGQALTDMLINAIGRYEQMQATRPFSGSGLKSA